MTVRALSLKLQKEQPGDDLTTFVNLFLFNAGVTQGALRWELLANDLDGNVEIHFEGLTDDILDLARSQDLPDDHPVFSNSLTPTIEEPPMHFTESDVREILDETPHDAIGARTVFVPLDEGHTAWSPEGPGLKFNRARGGGEIIGVVYVQFRDGSVAARAVSMPKKV